MKKKNKVMAVTASLMAAAVLLTSGAYALFQVRETQSTSGFAGEVDLSPEEININSMKLYVTGNEHEFTTGGYISSTTMPIKGWVPAGGAISSPIDVSDEIKFYNYGKHKNCPASENENGLGESTVEIVSGKYRAKNSTDTDPDAYQLYCPDCKQQFLGSTTFFAPYVYNATYIRTSNGEVAYCLDRGKGTPMGDMSEMSEKVHDKIKKVLSAGYPCKTAADYEEDITDAQLEWLTQLAVWITEGTSYQDGALHPEGVLTLDLFDKTVINMNTKATYDEKKAQDLRKVLVKILNAANNDSQETWEYAINVSLLDVSTDGQNYIVGPYRIDSNLPQNSNLSSTTENVKFADAAGNEITSIASNTDFFVKIPLTVQEEISITADVPGVKIEPSYMYWDGNVMNQRLVVGSPMDAKVTANISTVKELMPGDVIDMSWKVQNNANKAIVTRNRVYLWWEGGDDWDNAIENTFLYKQNVSSDLIRDDMLNGGVNADIRFPYAGDVHEFTLDGEVHTGYEFTMMGDWLDGVGKGAEVMRVDNPNLHYGEGEGEFDYFSDYDETDPTLDVIAFKLGFGQASNIHTSGMKLRMTVITEAIQWQNTNSSEFDTLDWSVIGRTSYEMN